MKGLLNRSKSKVTPSEKKPLKTKKKKEEEDVNEDNEKARLRRKKKKLSYRITHFFCGICIRHPLPAFIIFFAILMCGGLGFTVFNAYRARVAQENAAGKAMGVTNMEVWYLL